MRITKSKAATSEFFAGELKQRIQNLGMKFLARHWPTACTSLLVVEMPILKNADDTFWCNNTIGCWSGTDAPAMADPNTRSIAQSLSA